jgi:GT2 family glycosyltransferase
MNKKSKGCVIVAVVIGRNEGARLRRCLASVADIGRSVVYVDSASTDGSVELARSMGADVVELDESEPLTAARARNAGFKRALESSPTAKYVQFIDGDCELVRGWLERAERELDGNEQTAIVCGRLRERDRFASVYNRLCDMEWDTPAGEVRACGGIMMVRAELFGQIGGFNPSIMAGEDDDLCLRLRYAGFRIIKLPDLMALHDSEMLRFSQWWRRAIRSGHGFAQGCHFHGKHPERHWNRHRFSLLLWGCVIPIAAIGLVLTTGVIGSALLLLYPLQWGRIFLRMRKKGSAASDAALYSTACVVARFPNVIGAFIYYRDRFLGKASVLIEHKKADTR